jgi:hypothetical protein
MNSSDQLYVNHEVRLQLLEESIKENKEVMKGFQNEMHSNFRWTITMFMTILVAIITLFGGLLLTKLL